MRSNFALSLAISFLTFSTSFVYLVFASILHPNLKQRHLRMFFIEFFLRHIEFQTFQSVKNTLFGYFKNTFEWLGYFAKYQ